MRWRDEVDADVIVLAVVRAEVGDDLAPAGAAGLRFSE